MTPETPRKWATLVALCLAVLLVSMNSAIATIALPSIRTSLQISDGTLPWVVNAYLTAFGGVLLLAGRLSDFFGCRPLLLFGIVVFTLSSLACGLASTASQLIAARAAQGLGAAIMYVVSFSQLAALYPAPAERSRAFGIYNFVAASGASAGTVLGGALVASLDWHWVFLANVPAGVATLALCIAVLPAADRSQAEARLNLASAAIAIASLTLAISAIANSARLGIMSAQTLGTLGGAGVLCTVFIVLERRTSMPLVPLKLFRDKQLSTASVIVGFFAAAIAGGNFTAALYMQLVLLLDPFQLGLVFLPSTLAGAFTSLVATPALILRLGTTQTLRLGLLIVGASLGLLACGSTSGSSFTVLIVLTGLLLLGAGTGLSFNAVFLSGLRNTASANAGAASAIMNTSYIIGSALGLSAISSLSALRTTDLLSSGSPMLTAMNGGYRMGFVTGMVFAICAAMIGLRTQLDREAQTKLI